MIFFPNAYLAIEARSSSTSSREEVELFFLSLFRLSLAFSSFLSEGEREMPLAISCERDQALSRIVFSSSSCLLLFLSLKTPHPPPANLIHWGFEQPVRIEVQPCGKVPIQPRRSRSLMAEPELCPKHCLMRFHGASTDFGPGPLLVPVKKSQRSVVEITTSGQPAFIEKVRESYSGNGGSVQIFSYSEHPSGSIREVKVEPPSFSFPGQPVEVELAYKWSKQEGSPDCTFSLNWEIVDPNSLG